MKNLLNYFFILSFFISGFTIDDEMKPHVKVVRKKPDNCNGRGSFFENLYVSSNIKDEKIEVWLFIQKYDTHWFKKVYRINNGGVINSNLSSCEFTGNYMAVAFYNFEGVDHDINLREVPIIHNARGNKVKFKVTRRKKLSDTRGGGVYFEEGEVFTPKGEAVDITLFLEKKDGGWRKKHYSSIGSSNIILEVGGSDLTGRYKSLVTVKDDFSSI